MENNQEQIIINGIEIRKVSVRRWIFPMFGNRHYMPYGSLFVEYYDRNDNKLKYACVDTKGDVEGSKDVCQYVSINRYRYQVIINSGSYKPNIELRPMVKHIINRKVFWETR